MPAFQAEGLTSANLAREPQTGALDASMNGGMEVGETGSNTGGQRHFVSSRGTSERRNRLATRTHQLTHRSRCIAPRLLRLRVCAAPIFWASTPWAESADLLVRIDAIRPADDLTRTPFVLLKLLSLLRRMSKYPQRNRRPRTGFCVCRKQTRTEHRNALQVSPLFGRQTDYLTASLPNDPTRCRLIVQKLMPELIAAAVARDLSERGRSRG
jgi:hypothetical protein